MTTSNSEMEPLILFVIRDCYSSRKNRFHFYCNLRGTKILKLRLPTIVLNIVEQARSDKFWKSLKIQMRSFSSDAVSTTYSMLGAWGGWWPRMPRRSALYAGTLSRFSKSLSSSEAQTNKITDVYFGHFVCFSEFELHKLLGSFNSFSNSNLIMWNRFEY